MRHFVDGPFHWAGPWNPNPGMVELPEGDDGKCDWCRASDERKTA